MLHGVTECYIVTCYKVLRGVKEFYTVLNCVTECCTMFHGVKLFYRVLHDFTWFYTVFLSVARC